MKPNTHISKTAVVGAGTMGGGIAYVLSAAGLPVVVKDIDARQLALAREHVEGMYLRQVERGRMAPDQSRDNQALVRYTLSYEGLQDVDLVVEAVPEEMAIKRRVLSDLQAVCPPRTILATNTSALSISDIGAASGRPEKVIGLHFFNPAHVMKLVEVIPGDRTDRNVVETVVAFARKLGKTPVVVRECPGFVVNRLLMPYLNEAVICLQEGAATLAEIDAAMGREGFGWPMGPFTLIDTIGLDVCHHIIAYLASHYAERLSEAALLPALLDAGRLGRKSNAGFYEYPGGEPHPEIGALIDCLRLEGRVEQVGSTFSADRLMALLLNEAFLCLQEGIATEGDIDTACVAGLGMQVRSGEDLIPMGPFAYADRVGRDLLLARFRQLEAALGRRFRPARILEREGPSPEP
jgi:3-hydroxyacyl-CoA dehydrogenase